MLDQIFGQLLLNQWVVFAVLLIFLVGLSELAWRMGLARRPKKSEEDKPSGTVKSAVLALLGLLLGFSFALAGTRHEARRELLVEEANSIITTSRRAQLLPEAHAANVANLLHEYVPLRIEAHREGQFSDQFATIRKHSGELQDRMWAEAVAAAAERPSPITASFVASLNETIDMLSEAKHLRPFPLPDPFKFDLRFFASLRMTVVKSLLDINSHRNRAGNVLPAGALPEFSAAKIVIGHQDNRAHNTDPS